MYVIDLNFNHSGTEIIKRLISNKSMSELNELNNAYASRTRAMQQNWINDWVTLNQNVIAGSFNPHSGQAEKLPFTIQQQMANHCNEYTNLLGNACESYSLWFIKQTSSND